MCHRFSTVNLPLLIVNCLVLSEPFLNHIYLSKLHDTSNLPQYLVPAPEYVSALVRGVAGGDAVRDVFLQNQIA